MKRPEAIIKASHSAGFLVADLRAAYPLTTSIAEEMVCEQLLTAAIEIQHRLDRLAAEAEKGK